MRREEVWIKAILGILLQPQVSSLFLENAGIQNALQKAPMPLFITQDMCLL